MSSFKSRARKFAFGDSHENLSDASSTHSSIRSMSNSSDKGGVSRHASSISETCACHPSEKVHVTPKRTNRVRRLNRSLPFENFVEALETDGCVIVEDFVNPQISQRVLSAEDVTLDPEDERIPRSATIDVNEFVRESLANDSLYQLLSRHFLSLESISWRGRRAHSTGSLPRLSQSSTIDLTHDHLSVDDQSTDFRRADCAYHKRHAAAAKYDYQSHRDVTLGLFVPELDSLSASIPLRTIPGSHLWDDQKPDVSRGVKDVHLHGGDAMILLGSLYHQAGTGSPEQPAVARTEYGTPKEKLMHQIWMSSGVYRAMDELVHDDHA